MCQILRKKIRTLRVVVSGHKKNLVQEDDVKARNFG